MGFEEKDTVEQQEVTTKPVQVRFERASPTLIEEAVYEDEELVTPAVYGPPVDVYVVLDVDGHSDHILVDPATVAAAWDGPEKTLKAWVLAIIDAVA